MVVVALELGDMGLVGSFFYFFFFEKGGMMMRSQLILLHIILNEHRSSSAIHLNFIFSLIYTNPSERCLWTA